MISPVLVLVQNACLMRIGMSWDGSYLRGLLMYDIVDQTDGFILIYKKPGVGFHREVDQPGVFEALKAREGLPELYPVHRLDKVTSGLLLMAKTASVNHQLSTQFAERQVQKFYLALSARKPRKKQGLVKGDMVAARRGAWKLLPSCINPAVTQFFSCGMGQGLRLFILKPHTGKTHQLRVALKSLGAPILGDALYDHRDHAISWDRTYLHAYGLSFHVDGRQYRYRVLPQEGDAFMSLDFSTAVAAYLSPESLPWPEC